MLKAALKAGGAGKGPAAAKEIKLDASSFPCIDEGKPIADDVAANFGNLRLGSSTLAGSMPIRAGSYKDSVMPCSATAICAHPCSDQRQIMPLAPPVDGGKHDCSPTPVVHLLYFVMRLYAGGL
jgi:hypothetical protein